MIQLLLTIAQVIKGISSGVYFSLISCPKQAHSTDLATALINHHCNVKKTRLDEFFWS